LYRFTEVKIDKIMAQRKGISFNSRKCKDPKCRAPSNSWIIHGVIPPLLVRTVGRRRTSSSNNTIYNYKFSITKASLQEVPSLHIRLLFKAPNARHFQPPYSFYRLFLCYMIRTVHPYLK